MSDFNPYLKWLGIRETERPVNHYRLLGVENFESDPEVITAAADRQMLHVRSFQNGPEAVTCQKLLSELAIARRCLLTPEKKTFYDQQLLKKLTSVAAASSSAQTFAAPTLADETDSLKVIVNPTAVNVRADTDLRGRRKKIEQKQTTLTLIAWVGGAIAAVVFGGYMINSGMLPGVRLSGQTTEAETGNQIAIAAAAPENSDKSTANKPPTESAKEEKPSSDNSKQSASNAPLPRNENANVTPTPKPTSPAIADADESEKIEIVWATFGSGKNWVSVKVQMQDLIDGTSSRFVNNVPGLGIDDPIPGYVKKTDIQYRIHGKEKKATIWETHREQDLLDFLK